MSKSSMKRIMCLCLSLTLVLAMMAMLADKVEAAANVVEVDWQTEHQIMDGLGGAYAFNKADGIKQIYDNDPEVGRRLLDLMFSNENGIGISLFRVAIGDGGITNPATKAEWGNRFYDGPSDTIWPEKDAGFVWDQPDWGTEKASFDEAQIWIMKEAMSYGVEQFYANAWTPPYWMKTNNSVLGANGAKLKPDSYQDYADYLVQYALGYKREFGIPITHIGPANESESAHSSYSGFIITSSEYKDFVQNYLGPTLQVAIDEGEFSALDVAPPKIVAPEGTSLSASINLGRSMLEDPNSNQYIDVFSTHLYGTSSFNSGPLTSTGATGLYPDFLRNFTIWQTEYMTRSNSSHANDITQRYANQTISDGLYWANLLTNLFTSDPGFNSYIWWWPIANNGADGSDLVRLATTGSPQGNGSTVTGEHRVFKRFYTFGNFSRFVKPGDIRIDATRVPVNGLNVSAYKKPGNDDFSIIAVNSGSSDQNITFNLANFPVGTTGVVGYRTSASENQKLLDPIEVTAGSFDVIIPANSVITFVPNTDHNLPGLDDNRDIFSTLEAEDNDGSSTSFSVIPLTGTNAALSGVGNGDYISFKNINFADGSANGAIVRRHVLSLSAILASMNGGIIEMRIDDPETGKVVGTFNIPGKEDGDNYSAYTIQIDTGDNAAYGYRDVYMVFRGNGNELFNIDRFEFGEQVISNGSILPNGSFEDTRDTTWGTTYGSTGGTLAYVSEQNYSAPVTNATSTTAYSIRISDRVDSDIGVSQNITGKLTDGVKYKVNGFFMPKVDSSTGYINLVALNAGGGIAHTQTVALRSDLQANVWSQIDAVFEYEAPEVDFDELKIVFTDSGLDTLYIDEVSLVPYVDKEMLLNLLSATIDEGSFTEEAWDNVTSIIGEGWRLAIDVTSSQMAVDALVISLSEALAHTNYSMIALVGPESVLAGEEFDLIFGLSGFDISILAQIMTVSFDANQITFVDAKSLNDDLKVILYEELEPGKIRLLNVLLSDLQLDSNGDMVKLQFKAKTDAEGGNVTISISDVEFADENFNEIGIIGASHHMELVSIHKSELLDLIQVAEALYNDAVEGRLPGQYPNGSRAVLDAAILAAHQVSHDGSATQDNVNQAVTELELAIQTFSDLLIKSIPGDYNDDNNIGIGDLAMMVVAYGASSVDPGWAKVKYYDLNDDDVIDIEDLVIMARMILIGKK